MTVGEQNCCVFSGYSNKLFAIGAEYNNQMNRSFIDGCDYSGYSVYAGVPLGEKVAVYGRYDHVDTDTPGGITYDWSQIVNKDVLIAGFEYHPINQLSISPNYRYLKPLEGDGQHFVALNVGFSW